MIGGCARLAAITLAGVAALPVHAQSVSRPVVQPVPPPEARDLANALSRLARNPQDLGALLAAGEAALAVGDEDAALGFYRRASDVAPNDPLMLSGLGEALVRTGDPVDALEQFGRAEAAGARPGAIAAGRGRAFALVGDPQRAVAAYTLALLVDDNARTQRDLALAQALNGDRAAFEETLRPLLARRDGASLRTQAFGLAILGAADEALAVTEATMSAEAAARFAPFFTIMPRLTRAQQAEAALQGRFPQADRIGVDRPAIAAYRPRETGLASLDARLAPTGAPMGSASAEPNAQTPLEGVRRRPGPPSDAAEGATPTRTEAQRRAERIARRQASDPFLRAQRERLVRPEPPATEPEAPRPRIDLALPSASSPPSAPSSARPDPFVPGSGELAPVAPAAGVVESAAPVPAPVAKDRAADLGAQIAALAQEGAPVPASPTEPPAPTNVAEAFDGFLARAEPTPVRSGEAVDITRINPPREREIEPATSSAAADPPPPPAETHPSRRWVQIATGRQRDALRFDWRRIARSAGGTLEGKGPFTTPWNRAHRLLAGPYPDAAAARAALNALSDAGIDAFLFTSDAGQPIEPLE